MEALLITLFVLALVFGYAVVVFVVHDELVKRDIGVTHYHSIDDDTVGAWVIAAFWFATLPAFGAGKLARSLHGGNFDWLREKPKPVEDDGVLPPMGG